MQTPISNVNGFTLQQNNAGANTRMYSRDEPSMLHSSGRTVNPNIVQISGVRSGMSTPSYVPQRVSIQPPPPAPAATTTTVYQQPVYGQVTMQAAQYAPAPAQYTAAPAYTTTQYTGAATQQYAAPSAPVFTTTYYAQTAPASGAQTPINSQARPPIGSSQPRTGMYGMPHSMPASMPRTPYNEPVGMSPYKPMTNEPRTPYAAAADHHMTYAHRYSPDQAELRVRNLIADTERMLAGLSVPSKPDGLTL